MQSRDAANELMPGLGNLLPFVELTRSACDTSEIHENWEDMDDGQRQAACALVYQALNDEQIFGLMTAYAGFEKHVKIAIRAAASHVSAQHDDIPF